MCLGENPRPTKPQPVAELLKAGKSSQVGLYPHDLHPGLGRVSYMRNQTRIAASTTPARYVTASLS